MLELAILVVSVAAVVVLTRPVRRNRPVPGWLVRARARGRPGVPFLAVFGTLVVMGLAWALGERRGVLGGLLYIVWVGVPAAAFMILRYWRKAGRSQD